jgi:hypothetical protein
MKQTLLILMIFLTFSAARADEDRLYALASIEGVFLCDESTEAGEIPDFHTPSCKPVEGPYISPYRRHIWITANFDIPPAMAESAAPHGFFISAKASSTVWLNGSRLGSNGKPARTREQEVPGLMDTVFPLPANSLQAGENTVVIEMSGHNARIALMAPVHMIAIAPYQSPTDDRLRQYLPSFVPFGILVLGALYFGAAAFRSGGPQHFLVPLTALFAAAQLGIEVSRGLYAYHYPFHDVRLLLILVFATGTGACLFLHVLFRFVKKRRMALGLGALVAYFVIVLPAEGFDTKSSLAILLPSMLAALISAYAITQRRKGAIPYTAVLFLFTGLIFLTPSRFLDIYFYYCVAALHVFLFAQELRTHFAERALREQEKARADQLELALSESRERDSPSIVQVTSAGKVEILKTADIAYARGAGDYVDLVLKDGTTRLHSATLTEMESQLPGVFLRVHRSYLVNTAFVVALERDASGAGTLELTGGESVPVSRRVMPSVRRALT